MDYIYCNINGKRKKIFLRMSIPFPDHFKSSINLEDLKKGNTFFLIHDEVFLFKGNLKLPIKNSEYFFLWDIWISVKKDDFLKNIDPLTKKPIDYLFRYQGKLESNLPFYNNLESRDIYFRHDDNKDSLPIIELQNESELREDQLNGVSMEKVKTWMIKLYSNKD